MAKKKKQKKIETDLVEGVLNEELALGVDSDNARTGDLDSESDDAGIVEAPSTPIQKPVKKPSAKVPGKMQKFLNK
jgi:hypothetical protein